MSSQENSSRRSTSRTHSHADRNTMERSRVSNVNVQAAMGSTQDSMNALHLSTIPAERDRPPSYPNSLDHATSANHPSRSDATTQSVTQPNTTSSKTKERARRMPGPRHIQSNVVDDINNQNIAILASRNVGQSSSAARTRSSDHGNQGGGTDSLAKVQITRLEYVPSASSASFHTSTGPVHESAPNREVEVTQSRGETRSYHSSSFLSSLSPRSSKQHLYHTDYKSALLSKDLNDNNYGYYLEYMRSGILEKSSDIPLFRPSPVTKIMPGDVGQFQADGSFRSLFNLYLTAQENKKRFHQDPPGGFTPFQGSNAVDCETRNDSILSKGNPSGPEYFQELPNSLGSTGQALYEFEISPSLSDAVSVLVFPNSNYRICHLLALTKGDEYFESQLKSWYDSVLPGLNKKERNGRLVLVEGTYVTDTVFGLLHYTKDRARTVKPDDKITGTFERKLYTTDAGGQLYKYVWNNITGPGSSPTNLKRTTLEPESHNGNPLCFGIAARSLWEK